MATARLTSIRGTEYLGSHPSAPSSLPDVDLVFTTVGVRFERKSDKLGSLTWNDVTDIAVDGTHTTRKMSVPRVWLFGLFAALFQRRTDTALVRISTDDGDWVFGVDDLTADELRAGLAKLRRYRRA